MKKTMKKIILLIWVSVIAGTAIFAGLFREYISITFWSIPIAALVAFMAIYALAMRTGHIVDRRMGRKGRLSLSDSSYDFKYTKNNGVGSVEVQRKKREITKGDIVGSNILYILSAMFFPFIFLFSDKVKITVAGGFFCVVGLGGMVFLGVIIALAVKKSAEEAKKSDEEARRLVEEQKRREEMGKWK